jgi:two-component system chemotaxis response regulator CheB
VSAHDIVVIGGSAGGLPALMRLLRQLPPAVPVAVFVVLHQAAGRRSKVPAILARASGRPVVEPADGEPVRPGWLYVAPPDRHHVLLEAGRVRLREGPKEHGFRPAVDPLFRSAARAYGPRVVGVVLSGGGTDGAEGLMAVQRAGGVAVVQEPAEALVPSMPASAARRVARPYRLPSAAIGTLLAALAPDADPPALRPAPPPSCGSAPDVPAAPVPA